MAFTRKTLTGYGLTEEQLEKVMTLYSTSLADYIPKADLQAKIDEEVKKATENQPPVDVTQSDEYKKLQGERDMLRALGTDDFSGIKPKFRETVYNMLNREDVAPSVEEQLKKVAEDYEEYFEPTTTAEPGKTPQFGAGVSGTMPTGQEKTTVDGIWFGSKK